MASLPCVLREYLWLGESEVAYGIGTCLRVGGGVSEERIAERITRRVASAAGEVGLSVVVRAAILIDALPDEDAARFDQMVPFTIEMVSSAWMSVVGELSEK